ncbi:peptidase M42 [Flavonifractor sp. An135]|nr:M20/M25/M40 family metallo-hydrolase [Flavonifractor sp. An135]OUQ22391.1 peptidase M42 [Flavonifractor sp. An135]
MNQRFLYDMLTTESVSGGEIALQKKVMAYMKEQGVTVETDRCGNVVSVLNPESPIKVLLCGHIDEIGYRVTHITDEGYLKVAMAGGVRLALAQGKRVTVLGKRRITGVMGLLLDKGEVRTDIQATDLYIDCGFTSREEAAALVSPGDFVTYTDTVDELQNHRIAGRGLDDRLGAYTVLRALLRAREKGAKVGVYAATTVGEETTMRGAYHVASRLEPTLAIAVDVIHSSDFSGSLPQRFGDIRLGGGPVLCHSAACSAPVNRALADAAERLGLAVQYEVTPRVMGTDADKINQTGKGVPVTTVSIPLRYMHTPAEVASLDDVDQTVELLAEFLCGLEGVNLDPFAD